MSSQLLILLTSFGLALTFIPGTLAFNSSSLPANRAQTGNSPAAPSFGVRTTSFQQSQPLMSRSKEELPVLKMVFVDQALLSETQRQAFQRYLQTADLPPTKIGSHCQYYGKPQAWCLLLDPALGQRVYQQISSQPGFGAMAQMKDVRKLQDTSSPLPQVELSEGEEGLSH